MRVKSAVALAGVVLFATAVARTDEQDKLRSVGQGRALFLANCASCHGTDAKGGIRDLGPRSSEEKVPVPDLTTIESRDGRFDARHVVRHVEGSDKRRSDQCTTGMACWQHVFSDQHGADVARLRLFNLVNYLRSVQQPSGK
jgi:mono/diheme cytochrome c family protein